MHDVESHPSRPLPGRPRGPTVYRNASMQLVKSYTAPAGWQEILAKLIQNRVLPELAQALTHTTAEHQHPALPDAYCEALVQALMRDGQSQGRKIITALAQSGIPAEILIRDVIAPAARRFGTLWENDTCNFLQVALGIHDMRALMRDLPPAPPPTSQARSGRILLLPAPTDQHTFGAEVAARLFQQNSWEAQVTTAPRAQAILSAELFDVVGFSLSSEVALPELQDAIEGVRRSSRNKAIHVLAGGSLFDRYPALGSSIGVDVAINTRWEILFWGRQPDSWTAARLRRILSFSSVEPDSDGDKQCAAKGFDRTTEDDTWRRRRSEHSPAVSDP